MAISFPISMPTSPGFLRFRMAPESVIAMSESPFTLDQQVYEHAGQRWAAEITLPRMKRDKAAPWIAFFLKLNGRRGTFLLGDPDATSPQGIATGTPLVKGASQTGKTLDTDGWTASKTGILKAGDYIQLGSGSSSRLHMVVTDADSDASGNATLDIWPNLRTSPADNAAIVTSSPKGVFRLAGNRMPWDTDHNKVFDIAFSCIEAL